MIRRKPVLHVFLLCVFPLALAANGWGQTFLPEEAKPVVVWDNAERGPDATQITDAFGGEHFYTLLTQYAHVRRAAPRDGLAGVPAYVLYAPLLPVQPEDAERIDAYVRGGGRMLLVAVQSESIVELQKRLKLRMARTPLRDDSRAVEANSLAFLVDPVPRRPLAEGVGRVAVAQAFAVTGPGGKTRTVLATGPNAFTDKNRNGLPDDGTPRRRHPVAVRVRVGKGEVLFLGDDAILANQPLSQIPGNLRFADNVARWLAGMLH